MRRGRRRVVNDLPPRGKAVATVVIQTQERSQMHDMEIFKGLDTWEILRRDGIASLQDWGD